MTHVLGPANLIRIDAAQIGELVVFGYDSARALGIIFEFNEDRDGLLGVLSSSFEIPRLIRVSGDTLCINHGQSWVLEPVDSQAAVPSHFEVRQRGGLLVLTRGGWFINFATSNVDQLGRFDWEWRGLATFDHTVRCDKGAVFDEWKLWVNTAERDCPNGQPILSYKAEPQKAHQG